MNRECVKIISKINEYARGLMSFLPQGDILNDAFPTWSFLQSCIEAKDLSEFDLSIAGRIISPGKDNEHLAAFVCALSLACREGHLCLNQDLLTTIFPDSPRKKQFEELAKQGALEVETLKKYIVFENDFFYFKRFHNLEAQICKDLLRLSERSFSAINHPQAVLHYQLKSEQKNAVEQTLSRGFCLLSGGPGTGKTFTAAHIVSAFLQINPEGYIGICAPTGKAASHLEKMLHYHLPKDREYLFESGTIHSLFRLGRRSTWNQQIGPVFFDLLIIDECSMIDAELFAIVLSKISAKTRIVLIGDGAQLAPVETGSLFTDIAESLSEGFPLPMVTLKNSMRSDNRTLLEFANAVLMQNSSSFEIGVDNFRHPGLSEAINSPDVFYDALCNFTEGYRILSCLRRGPFGVDAINSALVQRICKMKNNSTLAIPVLITKTQEKEGLSKGEIGTLIVHNPALLEKTGQLNLHQDYMLFDKDRDRPRRIPVSAISSWDYAYCLSVHQSQGSEFDHVLLLVPPGSERFGKEVLYTAMTRARKSLLIAGSKETLQATMLHSSRRLSGIKNRLLCIPS